MKERRRFSLKTRSLDEARRRRDMYFRHLADSGDPAMAQQDCVAGRDSHLDSDIDLLRELTDAVGT